MNTTLFQALQTFPGHFELHLSVLLNDAADGCQPARQTELIRFEHFCREQGARALVIQLSSGLTPRQPMLSLQLKDTPEQVYQRILSLCEALKLADFELTRLKVEASVYNQGLPQTAQQAAVYQGYFEHHLKLKLQPGQNLNELAAALKPFGGYLSANALKENLQERFVTQRVKAGEPRAVWELDKLTGFCRAQGLEICKQVREYIIYDSCLALDAGWLD